VPDAIPPRAPAAARPTSELDPDTEFWGEPRKNHAVPPRPHVATGIEALRDRFDEWRADTRLGVIAMVVVAVIAGVVWYRVGVSGGNETSRLARSETPTTTAQSTAPPGTETDAVVVHVAGAVTQPGVVELPMGARVIDAIEAAGGGLLNADFNQLNLAARLADGQRVLVPKLGEALPPDPAVGGSVSGGAEGGLLNLNTATTAQLEELPGIGPALATAILDERDRRGGFQSVNELREVRGIGEKRFADLRDHVTV
jgi:competence protein ComEA